MQNGYLVILSFPLHLLAKILLQKTCFYLVTWCETNSELFFFTSLHIVSWLPSMPSELVVVIVYAVIINLQILAFLMYFNLLQSLFSLMLRSFHLWLPMVIWDDFNSLLAFLRRCLRLLLLISCSRLGISHFSKNAVFLLESNVI